MSDKINSELDDYEREIEQGFDQHKPLSPEEFVREAYPVKSSGKEFFKKR